MLVILLNAAFFMDCVMELHRSCSPLSGGSSFEIIGIRVIAKEMAKTPVSRLHLQTKGNHGMAFLTGSRLHHA